jgi:hypothetical protein
MKLRWVAFALVVVALASTAGAETLSPLFNPQTMMPTSEIERGMRAVGRSVFHGTTITDFGMEILAVLEKGNNGHDLIIARILDGPVVDRKCGVMGGMSGSPVYINGRLIGAVAYTYSFELEPVAGVTCINSMLDSLDTGAAQTALVPTEVPAEAYHSRDGAFALDGRQVTDVRVASRTAVTSAYADEHTLNMVPVAAPIYCSGLSAPAMKYLASALKPYGMEPVMGPAVMTSPVPVDFVPGAAFGVPLVWGDFDISTGGTLTYRDGNLVLGFGHPFMESGKCSVPMTTSWVYDFVPQFDRTDKMMAPMTEVGALTQDRPWAVGGVMGATAPRVPATITVTDKTRNRTRTYHCETMLDRQMTGTMLAMAAMSALGENYSGTDEGMVSVKLRVEGAAGDVIARADRFYHDGSPTGPMIEDLMQACSMLNTNIYRPQDVRSVEICAEASLGDETATIESVSLDTPVAKAGEPVTLRIKLRPDAAPPVEKVVTLQMPIGLAAGSLRVGICSGSDALRMRARVGAMPPPMFELKDAIDVFANRERADQLFVVAGIADNNLGVRNTSLPGAQRLFRAVLESAPRTDLARGGTDIAQTLDMPWVIYGGAMVTMPAEDREGHKGKPTTSGASRPPGGPPSEDGEASTSLLPPGVPAGLWWAAPVFRRAAVAEKVLPQRASPLLRANGDEDEEDEGLGDEDEGDEEPPAPPAKPTPPAPAPPAKPEPPAKKEDAAQPADKAEGNVGRGPAVWTQTATAEFLEGECKATAVRTDGAVQLAPAWQAGERTTEPAVWALAAAGEVAYAGALDGGQVYRLAAGVRTPWYKTGQFGVTALLAEKSGALLAATTPGGRVFRITGQDQGAELFRVPTGHVWDLCADGKDGVWVAAGPDATLYHADAAGKLEQVLTLRQGHIARLLMRGTDLYMGTAEYGAVYKLTAERQLSSVYDAGKNDITALAAGDSGALLVGTAPEGKVVSLSPRGDMTVLYQDGGMGVFCLQPSADGVYAGLSDKGRIICIRDAKTHALVRDDKDGEVLALCQAGPWLYAGCSNPGQVLSANLQGPTEGEYLSPVFDAKLPARWGRADWGATLPPGCSLKLQVRSGSSRDPKDASWSSWSLPLTEPGRDLVAAPAGEFLQYRLELARDSGGAWPAMEWVRMSYLPANGEPVIKEAKPAEGEAVSGKVKLQWKMEDPDKDKLQVKLLARRAGKLDYVIMREGILKPEYEWDTKSLEDGLYDLRLVVDDSLSNPTDAREATVSIAGVTVDNTAPEATLTSGPAEQANGGFALAGFATDATSRVANIAWQAKGSDKWTAARLDDGLYDWRYERFLVTTPPIPEDVPELTLRVRDAAGNVTDKKVPLPRKPAG